MVAHNRNVTKQIMDVQRNTEARSRICYGGKQTVLHISCVCDRARVCEGMRLCVCVCVCECTSAGVCLLTYLVCHAQAPYCLRFL